MFDLEDYSGAFVNRLNRQTDRSKIKVFMASFTV